jgi:uncharacterized membrane protein YcaP (DUF421 family)
MKNKGQSRKMSLAESILNIIIGFVVAISAQYAIFPLFDIHIPMHDHLLIGVAFTIVSLVRSYYLRRFFNWIYIRKNV